MTKETWRTIAIIFIILFTLETGWIVWVNLYATNLEHKTNICYYDTCEDYPDAVFSDDICTCYEFDIVGDRVIAKTEYMD